MKTRVLAGFQVTGRKKMAIDWSTGGGEPLACRHYQGKDPETGFQMCRLRSGRPIQWCMYTLYGAMSWCRDYSGPRGFVEAKRESNRRKLLMGRFESMRGKQ